MYLKKRIAVLLAIVMTIGSCFTVYADDPVRNGASEGTGYSYDHVDKEVWNCTLPTVPEKSPFDFVVDPERLVNEAGTLGNKWVVTPNDDGVYFYNNVSANIGPSSSSLTVSGENSVSVDVIASVTLGEKADNEISIVQTEEELLALSADNVPALLLNISVSGQNVAVSYNETTENTVTINGVPENFTFEANPDGDPSVIGQFRYRLKDEAKGETLLPWEEATISLNGVVNKTDVPEGAQALKVPKINVTWSYKKSGEPNTYATPARLVVGSNPIVTIKTPTGVSIAGIAINTLDGRRVAAVGGNHYNLSSDRTQLTFPNLSSAWDNVELTYSDGHVDHLKVVSE